MNKLLKNCVVATCGILASLNAFAFANNLTAKEAKSFSYFAQAMKQNEWRNWKYSDVPAEVFQHMNNYFSRLKDEVFKGWSKENRLKGKPVQELYYSPAKSSDQKREIYQLKEGDTYKDPNFICAFTDLQEVKLQSMADTYFCNEEVDEDFWDDAEDCDVIFKINNFSEDLKVNLYVRTRPNPKYWDLGYVFPKNTEFIVKGIEEGANNKIIEVEICKQEEPQFIPFQSPISAEEISKSQEACIERFNEYPKDSIKNLEKYYSYLSNFHATLANRKEQWAFAQYLMNIEDPQGIFAKGPDINLEQSLFERIPGCENNLTLFKMIPEILIEEIKKPDFKFPPEPYKFIPMKGDTILCNNICTSLNPIKAFWGGYYSRSLALLKINVPAGTKVIAIGGMDCCEGENLCCDVFLHKETKFQFKKSYPSSNAPFKMIVEVDVIK